MTIYATTRINTGIASVCIIVIGSSIISSKFDKLKMAFIPKGIRHTMAKSITTPILIKDAMAISPKYYL